MANTPTTDLTEYWTDNNNGTSADAAWTELANYGAGAAPSLDEEAYLQGTNATSQQIASNKTGAASGMDYAGTDPAGFTDEAGGSNGDAFFFWWLFLFPSALNAYNETAGQTAPTQNTPGTASGFFIGIGSVDGDHKWFAVGGSDYGRYPYGGWQNVAIDPTRSASFTDGTPTASVYANVGYLPNVVSAPSRGQSLVVDAIRWGRGLIEYTGGTPAGTFDAIATENDSTTNRWGLFQAQAGAYLWKGHLSLGTAAASLLFSDSNKTINIDDTRQVYSGFNLFEINNAASNIILTNITINKLKYIDSLAFDNSKGIFTVNDGATVDMDGCSFNDMDTFTFGSGCDVATTSFTRCAQVTQSGAPFTDCAFINSTATTSFLVDDLSNVLGVHTFESDGSNHAIELTAIPAGGSYTWSHTTSGYVAGSAGSFTSANDSETGNETIYINPPVSTSTNLTITYTSGVTIPSIRIGANYTGTVTVQAQGKTIDVNVKDENGVNVSGAFVWLNDGVITIFNGTTDASGNIPQQSYSGSNNTTLRVRRFGYEPFETTLGTATGNASALVTLLSDDQQVAVPTLNQTWTIDTTGQTITRSSGVTLPFTAYSQIDTAQDLYEFVQNTFAATSFMEFPVPLESVTRTQYRFINGYTFLNKDDDYKYLYDGSFRDQANSLTWGNIRTIGSIEGGGIYIVQGTENADSKLSTWWPDGNINVLVKIEDGTFIQSTDDNSISVNGAVWLFCRDYGDLYDHFFVELGEGQSVAALSTFNDPNNQTASGTVSGYLTLGTHFTFNNAVDQDIGDGAGPQPYDVVINCNGNTLKQVYEYTKYITSEDFSSLFFTNEDGFEYRNADEATFSNVDVKQAPFGTFAGGRFFGARGVFLTNMASADNTNYELIDSNGVTRTPPVTYSFELTGLKDGTEVRIFNSSTSAAIAGVEDITNGISAQASTGVTTSGTTDNNTFVYTYTYTVDIPIFVVILNLQYQYFRLDNLLLEESNKSIPVSQINDRNYSDPD